MSVNQLVALLSSHIQGDEEQFLSIALQAAAQQARQGKKASAEKLKSLVQQARESQQIKKPAGLNTIPLARTHDDLKELVESSFPTSNIKGMILDNETSSRLQRVLKHQKHRKTLRDQNLTPAKNILLVGPPGTGKTMTASALAGELHLPLFTIKLDSVFSRYFGETASKLRILFDQIANTRGVYLLDEFDALGGSRGSPNDIGEARRVLNSILGYMEEENTTDSVVIAATNHSAFLDDALVRRFDEVVEYSLPNEIDACELIKQVLGRYKLSPARWKSIEPLALGLSQGEIVKATKVALKDAILDNVNTVPLSSLKITLEDRQRFRLSFSKLKVE